MCRETSRIVNGPTDKLIFPSNDGTAHDALYPHQRYCQQSEIHPKFNQLKITSTSSSLLRSEYIHRQTRPSWTMYFFVYFWFCIPLKNWHELLKIYHSNYNQLALYSVQNRWRSKSKITEISFYLYHSKRGWYQLPVLLFLCTLYGVLAHLNHWKLIMNCVISPLLSLVYSC